MTGAPRILQSAYMNFAKLETHSRYNLATSGVADAALSDLKVELADLALHGENIYGYGPLNERIGDRFGVDPACVVAAGGGASFANHLAMAARLAPGDEVLAEDPTYELLLSTLGYLQADVRPFARRLEHRWALDAGEVADRLTPRTRLVVLTNLHNPSSALETEATIHAVAAAADKVGAKVLIDEVYLEMMFQDGAARTAFRADGNIIATSSLTKAYGLSGIRCGWILAPAALAQKMRRLNDLFGVHPPHISERLGLVAIDRLGPVRKRAIAMIDANRAAYREILGDHPKLDQVVFDQGTTVFAKLRGEDGDAFFQRLTSRFETSVVPGRHFGCPQFVRIGLGGDVAMTRVGLQRIAEALAG